MKDLVKSSILIGSSEVVIIFVSIIRAKYLALHIGAAGYGEYALISSFFSILTAVCGGWIARGTIKYLAEYIHEKDNDSASKVHNYSISVALVLGSIVTVIVFAFQDYIRVEILSPNIVSLHYNLFAASFLATSLTPFFGWLLQSYLKVKSTVKLRVYHSLFSLLAVLVFVYFFELTGYFLSVLVTAVFGLFIYWKETKKIIQTKFILPKLNDEIFKKLTNFGGVNFILLIVNNISEYIQRMFILGALNIAAVGLFQVANSIMSYMGIANRATLFINDTKMSTNMTISERNKALNDFLRLNMLIGFPISLILILFSKHFVTLLYSKEFVTLSPLLSVFIISQFLSFLVGGFQSLMLGKSFLKMHFIISLVYYLIVVVIPYFYIEKYGLIIIGLSMMFANLITLLVDYYFLKKVIGIEINNNVFLLFSFAFLSLIFVSVYRVESIIGQTLSVTFCFAILMFTISKTERMKIKNFVLSKINK